MVVSTLEFPAMGSACRILVTGDGGHEHRSLLTGARRRIADLESRWSRFAPTSELCTLNAADGGIRVSAETATLLALSVEAWSRTAGLFDPTVLTALEAAGYDRSFELLAAPGLPPRPPGGRPGPTPGCDQIGIDADGRVAVPHGVRLDLGGIGKGRAADLVATELLERGADGVCVDIGGDVRVLGRSPDPAGWAVAINGAGELDLGVVDLSDGAVATSSIARRRWTGARGPAHHLVDPRTGEPVVGDLLSVSVLAAEALWAEVYAKAALVAGAADGVALLVDAGLAAVLVTDGHDVITAGDIDRFLRDERARSTAGATGA